MYQLSDIRHQEGASRRWGFTLLEILLAVTILSLVASVTFMTFSAATSAWQKGTKLADSLHHGDYVMQQLVLGLRSAYYPDSGGKAAPEYGFWHEDNGEGASAEDEICWVKLGGAMVGSDAAFAETPHRVRFLLGEDEDGDSAAGVVAWRLQGQPEDFDPEEIETVFLSKRVVGFDCRTAWQMDEDGEIDWLDEWEDTNKIPTIVEVSLYVEPTEEGADPVVMKRIIGLRVGALAWE